MVAGVGGASAGGLAPFAPSNGKATAEFNAARGEFRIANGVIEKRLTLSSAGRLSLSFIGFTGNQNWAATSTEWGSEFYSKAGDSFAFGFSDTRRFRFVRHEVEGDGLPAIELRLYFEELALHLEYTLHTRAFADVPVFVQWLEIHNRGDETVKKLERFDPLLLPLALDPADQCTLHYVKGCHDYGFARGVGSNINPFVPYRVRAVNIPPDDSYMLSSLPPHGLAKRLTSSMENMNWFSIELDKYKGGVFGGLEWSGEWVLNFGRSRSELVIQGGVDGCSHNLEPGKSITSPRVFVGFYRGDVDSGIHWMHRYLRTHVMPANPDANFPWACYNTWFSWSTQFDEKVLMKEARVVSELGLECFYVDAGWYAGSPKTGSFNIGLGNWTENRQKFPSGLARFSDYIRSLDMRFGLWVEPERVWEALVQDKSIPEPWLARRDSGYIKRRDTHQLCFGNPEVVDWAKRDLERVVREYRVEWLKWDHNLYDICTRDDHGHLPGDGNYFHILGLYEVLAHLRREFPKLVIESCSGGGNRNDFGIARYCNTAWNSDLTAPSYRVRNQTIGCSYVLPPQYQNAWFTQRREDPVSVSTPPAQLDAMFRSRMIGAFGISDRLLEWPSNIREAARRAVTEYKRLRPVLVSGDVHHILPQPALWVPPLRHPPEWAAIQYFHTALHRGIVLCFRGDSQEAAKRLRPRGLEARLSYTVEFANSGRKMTQNGGEWMDRGVLVEGLEKRTSEILWIEEHVS